MCVPPSSSQCGLARRAPMGCYGVEHSVEHGSLLPYPQAEARVQCGSPVTSIGEWLLFQGAHHASPPGAGPTRGRAQPRHRRRHNDPSTDCAAWS